MAQTADNRERVMRRFTAYIRADLPRQDFYQHMTPEQRRTIYEGIAEAARHVLDARARDAQAEAQRAKRRERYALQKAQAHAVAEAESILFAHA